MRWDDCEHPVSKLIPTQSFPGDQVWHLVSSVVYQIIKVQQISPGEFIE